ncbi:hypothetical protein BP6252_10827 [Coleophoma cylindrospora]|uniref:Lysine decarboxylase-like protein n=1 Tax=Coleophoma cylindrospora TaxID=1849047 RepID=A0A3D8QNA5_9HELO|nr:hypothetical protein BP6252_10827 [Coleophoma cylindrospora]
MQSTTDAKEEHPLLSMNSAPLSKIVPLAIAVFCGAKLGNDPEFAIAARSLAEAIHVQGWTIVYGAGTVGLMGEVSRALVKLSGPESVHGFIPKALVTVERARNPEMSDVKVREESYGSVTVVKDMHARKTQMAEAAGAFVALPGGFGTMEEIMEIITWNFLGIHDKPIVLFNVNGFFDDIMSWVRRAVKNGFVDSGNANIVVEASSAGEVIEAIKNYRVASSRHALDWKSNQS